MYAVAGTSGNTGAGVADTLLARGEKVRVIVRDAAKGEPWRARGAEVAGADLADEAAVVGALRGVDGAYLLVPPSWGSSAPGTDGRRVGEALARAAARAGAPHVVLLSSVGAQFPAGNGPIGAVLNPTERAFVAAGVPTTHLRAAYFVENWGAVLAVAKSDGVLPSFLAVDAPIPMVSVIDIGRVGAELLLAGPRGQRVVQLAGPVDPTPADVARTLAGLLGRPVQAAPVPLQAAEATLVGAGLPPAWAAMYRELYEGVANGKVALDHHEVVRGTVDLRTALARLVG